MGFSAWLHGSGPSASTTAAETGSGLASLATTESDAGARSGLMAEANNWRRIAADLWEMNE